MRRFLDPERRILVPLGMAQAFCLWSFLIAGAIGALSASCQDRVIEAMPDEYVGVGIELTLESAGARVVRALPDGAAARAGIAAGDVLLSVDGEMLRGKSLAEVVDALRGEPGTRVEVGVRTPKGNKTLVLSRQPVQR